MGFRPEYIGVLANQKVHLHFYGEIYQNSVGPYLKEAKKIGNNDFHAHPNCDQENWVSEFSKYDAGWLHLFDSANFGSLLKSDWNDLNYPARVATFAAAGVPMLQKDNSAHLVATQSLCKRLDIGILFKNVEDLGAIFQNRERLKIVRENVWNSRKLFQFDYHADDLIDFFKHVIANKKSLGNKKQKIVKLLYS